ncbi:EAL domain-containing protein [Alkalicaulis satelles]|uniref:EAL domain-containing protein n=1 Tax=Alkalicaulis satelles TaxID=2609175 RepID=A0A5M6ZCC3_9PROT|nr:EAL domain-containing protein [Alkalicaulis satelles]KAA5802379.1 EAL domain-containing protein [Alkalicaulis satelles]
MKARVSDILVVLTYAMIAVVAAIAFQRFNLMSAQLAWLMGAVVFLIAGQVHAAAARAEERARFEAELRALKRANAALAETLTNAQTRLDAIDAPAPEAAAALAGEPAPGRDEALVARILARLDAAEAPEPEPASEDAAVMVREALDANRVDLYLQPVVGLPQRRTYFYEGFTRLRDAAGQVVAPGAFLAAAEEAGLIAEVDNILLLRCVQIVRRLTKSDRRVGVFCNVSLRSLADEDFFPGFLDFLRRNGDLAGALIFEMPRAAFEGRSAIAARNMARLADYGFRFSLDQVSDLNLDLAELQRAGVRFVKVPGDKLVAAAHGGEPVAGREPGALPPEDIAGLFARYGVDLVAEKIETEATVVEVLDLDIAYAQGHLFGAPRPVRDEVLSQTDQDLRRTG